MRQMEPSTRQLAERELPIQLMGGRWLGAIEKRYSCLVYLRYPEDLATLGFLLAPIAEASSCTNSISWETVDQPPKHWLTCMISGKACSAEELSTRDYLPTYLGKQVRR